VPARCFSGLFEAFREEELASSIVAGVPVKERQEQADATLGLTSWYSVPVESCQLQLDAIMARMALLDWESDRQGLDLTP
jgi:hypothetical protein